MAITVIAQTRMERLKDLGSSSRRWGVTELKEVTILGIEYSRGPSDCSPGRCMCVLTEIKLEVNCVYRLNPTNIERSYFDPDSARPRAYVADEPRDPSHRKLDERSVLVHETSHCEDIAEAVRGDIERAFNKGKPEKQHWWECACERLDDCHDGLLKLVTKRVKGHGAEAHAKLRRQARKHKSKSATEVKARRAQIDDYAARS